MSKSKKTEPITHDEWLKALFPKSESVRPKNSFTIAEVCRATGMNERTIRARVSNKILKGELSFIVGTANGKQVNFYFEKKGNDPFS